MADEKSAGADREEDSDIVMNSPFRDLEPAFWQRRCAAVGENGNQRAKEKAWFGPTSS